jgi:hypothetical protein
MRFYWFLIAILGIGLCMGCPTETDDDASDDDTGDDDTSDDDTGDDDAGDDDTAGDDDGGDDDTAGDDDGGDDDTAAPECENWQTAHPQWIFCDDFESQDPLVGQGRYFEHGDNDGDCVVADGVGLDQSRGLTALWQPQEVGAGGVKLAFGRNPSNYMDTGIRPGEDFREIYYRMYLYSDVGWQGGDPAKLSRATVFASDDWSQAMIAHLWGDGAEHLLLDPARCVGTNNQVECVGYNDFANLDWLGYQPGTTPIFATSHSGIWYCIEHHVRLNDAGDSNGLQEFWIDGQLEASRTGLDFVRSYQDYAINAVFFENYWNDGSPVEQGRVFDNIVVSTEPIGCL